MKTRLLVIIGMLVIPFVIPQTFGVYVEFDDNNYKLFLNNKHVVDFQLNWASKDLPSGKITFDESINDTILLQIPKNIPRTTNLDFGHFSLFALQTDGSWPQIRETDSKCFYILEIPIHDSDYVEIFGASVAAGRWEPVVIDDPSCNSISDKIHNIPPPLKQLKDGVPIQRIQCNGDKILVHHISRERAACVTEETQLKLIVERGWGLLRFGVPAGTWEDTAEFLCELYKDESGNSGKWDPYQSTCDYMDSNHCSLIGGEYQECKSQCEPDNPYCVSLNVCSPTCIFDHEKPENDLYCNTVLVIQLKESIDFKTLEKTLREEVAKFGSAYDLSKREIKFTDLGENRIEVSIDGLWEVEDPTRPNLRAILEGVEIVDNTKEFPEEPTRSQCHHN